MSKKNLKYLIAFISVLAFRLIPFRAPNIEPVLAIQMPFAKTYGKLYAFLFGALSIVVLDLFTSELGIWTLITALTYGVLGLGAVYYFKKRSGWKNYAGFAVFATILYDAVTGLTIGPLLFGVPFMVALIGQIPFTILHLLGNVSFAIVLSPAIERWTSKADSKIKDSKVVLVS